MKNEVKAEEKAEEITKFVQEYVKGGKKGKIHGQQLEIILPETEREQFTKLFSQLEKSQEKLAISSFGLSLNTLEQVGFFNFIWNFSGFSHRG